jgi:protein disulfide-isomerase A6
MNAKVLLLAATAALCASQASALYSASDDVIQLDEKNFDKTGESGSARWARKRVPVALATCVARRMEQNRVVLATACFAHATYGVASLLITWTMPRSGTARALPLLHHLRTRVPHSRSLHPPSTPPLPSEPSPPAVIKGSGLYLVEFYAPWCGHCKSLAPAWKQAAKALKGIVNVVAVDGSASQSLASKYGVQGFPTIKLFGENKNSPVDYNGGRDAQSIVNWAMSQAQSVVKARMGGGGGNSGSGGAKSSGSGSGSGGGNKGSASSPGGGKDVVTLDANNFDELVLSSGDAWFVEFYAPWCGHCKSMAQDYAEAAAQMAGQVKFGAVDATQNEALAGRFGVRGYPTIKIFPGGPKNGDKSARDYNEGRTASDFVAAAARLAEATAPPPSVDQLLTQAQWDEACGGKRICILAVLPHILDDSASGRNARIAALTEAASKQRGKPYRFLWTEVGAQPKIEGAMAVGLVPAIFAVATDKKVFTVHKGAFEAGAISTFAASLTTTKGAAGAVPFPSSFDIKSSIAKADKWDGKDAKASAADEISLEELGL